MSTLTDTAPKRIWLCVSDDVDDNDTPYPELYAEDAEITWSTDQPVAVTVEYVRADIAEADLAAENLTLRNAAVNAAERSDALRHDIERHVAICAEQAEEVERLRARVAELEHTNSARVDQAERERDAAIAVVDANWVTHQQIVAVRAERAALAALLRRVLSCTDLRGWNGAKAELLCADIDAALKDKL